MRHLIALSIVAASAAVLAPSAHAALVLSQADGASPVSYTNGGGTGFTGAVGNGTITFDAVGTNLVVGFTPGGAVNDVVVIHLDTKSGGFADNAMSDTSDGGRNATTNPSGGGNVSFPVAADYSVTLGGSFGVGFELTGGTLNVVSTSGSNSSVTIPLASLGNPTAINWYAYYTSESTFLSNETMPASAALNGGGNPGFNSTVSIENHNQFTIPEPATLGALAGAGVLALRRRK